MACSPDIWRNFLASFPPGPELSIARPRVTRHIVERFALPLSVHRSIKYLIWLYLLLLIFEGALRKWVLPGYADALLVVRDPVVILIYLLAVAQGVFPLNGWVITAGVLAGASLFGSFMAGQSNLLITAYGLRSDFLHLPLIWVMAGVLTRRDVENLGKCILLLAIPMTSIMIAQFYSPVDSFINRGVGGEEGGQIYGALGHIRSPGFFSFITGPQLFVPLAAAFFCHQMIATRRLWFPLLLLCGAAILIAVPISISRTVAVATLFVFTIHVLACLRTGHSLKVVFRTGWILAAIIFACSFLPVFHHGTEAFASRWDQALAGSDDSVGISTILDRLFGGSDSILYFVNNTSLFGAGVGMGSNVAARLTTGNMGFLLAESELIRCIQELGPPLGLAFLGYRMILTLKLLKDSLLRLVRARDSLPLLVICAIGTAIGFGQWAPPTVLGFAILGGGLCLAACQDEPEEEDEEDEDEESDDPSDTTDQPDSTDDELDPSEEESRP